MKGNFDLKSDFDTENNLQTIRISGKIYMGDGDVLLRREIDNLADPSNINKPRAVILDLANCEYMCSGSLGEIIRSYTTTRRAGIEMVLTGLKGNIKDLMTATKLKTVFDIYDSKDDALKALSN